MYAMNTTLDEVPTRGERVSVLARAGWNWTCPTHGTRGWSHGKDDMKLGLALCGECGETLRCIEATPRRVTGYVVAVRETAGGKPLVYVHPLSRRGRASNAEQVVWTANPYLKTG